ncbi:MAG: M60 family metallopeptidase [Chitinophaga sp.]|uniref:M60 family metallopeptidase n=1 Tax=Chitinophaga sp. TaxID=1869181 RepID=UPI001B0C987A|nr:M60 family metallopeptidase [Chitinophaga sp.]MBO9731246.1 M60 family metallopeptidase [Chitinophaga sp.]
MKFTLLLPVVLLTATMNSYGQLAVTPENIVIHPGATLAVKDTALRIKVREWCTQQMNATTWKNVPAHPSSVYFPGPVKAGATPVTRTIHLQHKKIPGSYMPALSRLEFSSALTTWNLYSTGLYAPAGQVITIELPAALKHRHIEVQVGCHTDYLGYWMAWEEDWRRMPYVVKRVALDNATIKLTSRFGGLIYISANPVDTAWEADFKISGAIESPLFVLGKTTKAEWQEQLKNNKAPWGELMSDKMILSLPDSVLQKVQHPDSIMNLWNLIVGGEMELAQLPEQAYRPQRMVIDEHIAGGALHAGYPIMAHHSPSTGQLTADVMINPGQLLVPSKGGANWGFFHEIGHNMQNIDWVFGGTTEVSCNFFSLYMFDRLVGGRDGAHPGISNENTTLLMQQYFKNGAKYEAWQQEPFLGLIMFRQLQEAFGWEAFKTFFRRYQAFARKDPDGNYAKKEEDKRDLWAKTFSEVTGRNMAPFFEAWGIPISSGVKTELSHLPGWMPYNFPPRHSY